ncbi:calcium homeostasis endoplasmic reticulum protein [Babesia caballi]|uniref:Calcium homeostasis endoplasmic reticulum protein n=1 Tax=Babesia caballi TaxID=5871 RepID=A0AAV4LRM1_BABCB|nr:calcium homeostasis endoplasmic reticulum protein [Babesia caballi]
MTQTGVGIGSSAPVGDVTCPPKRKSRFDSPASLGAAQSFAPLTPGSALKHRQGAHPAFAAPPSFSSLRPSSPLSSNHASSHGFHPQASASRPAGAFAEPPPEPAPALPSALETCNVGVMASVILQLRRARRLTGAPLEPYAPLPADTAAPPYTRPRAISEVTNTRVADFYDDLEALMEAMGSRVPSGDPGYNYSRRKHFDVERQRSAPISVLPERELVRKGFSDLPDTPGLPGGNMPSSFVAPPLRAPHPGPAGFCYPAPPVDDFESFRKKRASPYHDNLVAKYALSPVHHSYPQGLCLSRLLDGGFVAGHLLPVRPAGPPRSGLRARPRLTVSARGTSSPL